MNPQYQPDFGRKDVRKRAQTALGWACAHLDAVKARPLSKAQITKRLGQAQNPFSSWLREQLLICNDHFYDPDTGEVKKWRLNLNGVALLQRMLTATNHSEIEEAINDVGIDWARSEYHKTIESGEFEYQEKSDRNWNELQFLRNDVRKPVFDSYGYIYNYDIEAAAPTLILQYARRCGLTRPTPILTDYIENKSLRRRELANRIGVNISVAKKIINARLAGAAMGMDNSIMRELGGNQRSYYLLKNDWWFIQLTKDIKKLWAAIRPYHAVTGRFNSRQKWRIYFKLENTVMTSVKQYLRKNKTRRVFLEHDGWRTDVQVDLYKLQRAIKQQTGYSVRFDEEVSDRVTVKDVLADIRVSQFSLLVDSQRTDHT